MIKNSKPVPYQGALNKIIKTREAIKVNYEFVKEDQLKNKLYKQFKQLASEMIGSIQYSINHKGGEGTISVGQTLLVFVGLIREDNFTYQEVINLESYIKKLITNL